MTDEGGHRASEEHQGKVTEDEAIKNEAIDNEAIDNEAVDNEAVDNEAADIDFDHAATGHERQITSQRIIGVKEPIDD